MRAGIPVMLGAVELWGTPLTSSDDVVTGAEVLPRAFSAVTAKVYVFPSVKPAMVHVSSKDVPLRVVEQLPETPPSLLVPDTTYW